MKFCTGNIHGVLLCSKCKRWRPYDLGTGQKSPEPDINFKCENFISDSHNIMILKTIYKALNHPKL